MGLLTQTNHPTKQPTIRVNFRSGRDRPYAVRLLPRPGIPWGLHPTHDILKSLGMLECFDVHETMHLHEPRHSLPGMMRFMKSSKSGTVNAVSP